MPYTISIYKKNRNFNPFVSELGKGFVAQIVDAYSSWVGEKPSETEKTYWHQIKTALKYFASSPDLENFRDVLRGDVSVNPEDDFMLWQVALSSYRHDVDMRNLEDTTKTNLVSAPRVFFCQHCANEGITPQGLSLEGWDINTALGTGSTAIDENTLSVLGQSEHSLMSLVAFIDDDDVTLDGDFIELLKQACRDAKDNDSQVNRVELAVNLLQGRITALKEAAAGIYVDYINATNQADKWVEDLHLIELADQLHDLFLGKSGKEGSTLGRSYRRVLENQALQVLVVWLKRYQEGRYPLSDNELYHVFNIRLTNFGIDRETIERYLGKSRLGLAAGYIFIMFETAGNSSSIWDLEVENLVHQHESDDTYHLNWIKRRSGVHQSMSSSFSVRKESLSSSTLSVKDVFEHQLVCRTEYLRDVRKEDRDKLFLSHYKNNTKSTETEERVYIPSHPTSGFLRGHFEDICNIASDGKWRTTPKAIRGSLLLLEGILTRDATAVAELGQHVGLQMANRYTFHLPEVLRREQNIRDFLDWFEALLTVDIEGFAKRIGIDELSYSERLETARLMRNAELKEALNQQFGGIHCADPRAGIQPGTEQGDICDKVEKCPTCTKRRGIFVLSENNILNVMHWHQELERAKQSLTAQLFKPWEIWHLFTSMILDRFGRNPGHSALFRLAEKRRANEINPYANLIQLKEVIE